MPQVSGGRRGEAVELLHRLVGGDGEAALAALLEGFKQEHPEIDLGDITDENLSLEVKSRILKEDPPDIWIEWPGMNLQPYTDANVIGDIDDVWADGDMERNYLDGPKEASQFDDVYRAVPLNIHRINNLFYNVDHVAELGIDPEQIESPRAFVDMLEAIQSESDHTGMLFPMKNPWTVLQMWETVLLGEHGHETYRAVTGSGATAHRRAIVESLEIVKAYAELATDDKLYLSLKDANDRFADGESTFFHQGDWAAGAYTETDSFDYRENWNQIPFPGTEGLYAINMDAVVAAESTENQEAVSAFLAYAGSTDGQKRFNHRKGSIPPRTDIDTSQFTQFLQDQQTDFEQSRSQPLSITHGLGVRPAQLIDLKTAMSKFVSTWDVDATAEMVIAAFEDAS